MPIATAEMIRNTGNLVDSISEATQITPHLTRAVAALQRFISLDVYNRIVDSHDAGGVKYTSNFGADVNGWAQNAGDANLVLSGNNDGVLGIDDALKVLASGSDIDFRIVRSADAPTGGKVYAIKFDYFAESACGVAFLGVEIDGSNRARDELGVFSALKVVEDYWQVGRSINFTGFGTTTLTGYTDAISESIDQLISGKSLYFKNITVTPLTDYAALQRAETLWTLSFLYPALAIHTAGRGLTLTGGSGDGAYSYVDYREALAMAKGFVGVAKTEVAKYIPILDLDQDDVSESLNLGGLSMVAVTNELPVSTDPRISL